MLKNEYVDTIKTKADEFKERGDGKEYEMLKGFLHHLDCQLISVPSQRDLEILANAYYCKSCR